VLMLRRLNCPGIKSSDVALQMLRVLDKDGDGTIDYEEVRQRVCFFVFAVVLFCFAGHSFFIPVPFCSS
jgi:hypothetical protein